MGRNAQKLLEEKGSAGAAWRRPGLPLHSAQQPPAFAGTRAAVDAGTGCPGSQGQAEVRAGLGQALAEEALVKQILWQLSGHWGWAGGGRQPGFPCQLASGTTFPHGFWQAAQAAGEHRLPGGSQAAAAAGSQAASQLWRRQQAPGPDRRTKFSW